MATTLTEIAPDLFRISTFVPEAGIQFNQFLVRDDEPLLFETGYRSMFEIVREQVARVLDPSDIRWIGFSHFEGDECGALNERLQLAPEAQAVCSLVGAVTSVQDFAIRPPRAMQHDEVLATGRRAAARHGPVDGHRPEVQPRDRRPAAGVARSSGRAGRVALGSASRGCC